MIRVIFVSLLIFVLSALSSSPVSAVTYSGSFPNGLVVSENNAIVENANITTTGSGVCLRITGDNVTVRNSVIHDCQDHGVIFLGTSGGIFENNEIYRAAMRHRPNTVSHGWPSLLKVQSIDESSSGLAKNIIIRNNFIHSGYGECMGLRGSYITVSGNHVKDCYSIGIYSNSDHTTVSNNRVECTENQEYFREGLPMAGIAFAEESFSGWGAHGHLAQTVTHNTVTGCKYGFRYGRSVNNNGLKDTTIAHNSFLNSKNSPISITSYPNESNLNIHSNNTGGTGVTLPQPSGTMAGDFNGDRRVDLKDYLVLVSKFGNPYSLKDYLLLIANFGR